MGNDTFKKVIIAGSREFSTAEHYLILQQQMDDLIVEFGLPDEIISGGARGADRLGERYATENSIAIVRFIPEWALLGKRAGFARNQDMGNYSDTLVAFWDGASSGTIQMVEFAQMRGLDVILVRFNK
jgi:hypothetical protein